ncbi:hypothetical protein CAEBREN_02672 [Caenorhabditis brenneri]|uniref:F-box domain-containing protein n=1 Tax=Caenorhabditis brenneri TaxID=135651 RepID=G0NIB8_CAEBE|nr:hypothetical protein CAEBREN_02672 [Caenorhabditis brenneri]
MAETTVTQPCLECMPPMILDKIVKDIDYKQIVNLRLVCQNLKAYVDTYRPNFNLKYIIVNAITSGFLIHFGANKENFEKKNYEKTVMSVDGDDETPLETLLLHQKSTLEVLQLNCSLEENVAGYGKVLEKIQTILTGQNRQLLVKSFKIDAQNEDQVMRVLPYLDPKVLQSVYINNPHQFNMSEANTFMEIEKLKGLDQWKEAKKFTTQNLLINAQITELDHFYWFDITVDTLKMSHVILLKEKFAALPTEKSARIRYRNLNQDVEIPEGNRVGYNEYEFPVNDENMRLRLKLDKNSVDIEKELYPRPRASPEFYPVPEI